jgi:hypothetical protein
MSKKVSLVCGVKILVFYFLFHENIFVLADKSKREGKLAEVVLLDYHSHLSRFGNFHISSCAWKSIKLARVLFVGSIGADKRNITLGYRWGNILVWKEKGKETIISLLLGFCSTGNKRLISL